MYHGDSAWHIMNRDQIRSSIISEVQGKYGKYGYSNVQCHETRPWTGTYSKIIKVNSFAFFFVVF